MDASRRSFIKNSAMLVAGAAVFSSEMWASPTKIERLGIQLYSVRDAMKSNPLATLKSLSAMGYQHVEHANYIDRKFYGYSAREFKKILDDLGLLMPSGHTVMTARHWDNTKNDFTDDWKHTIEDALKVGQKYLISPWLDESLRTDTEALKRYLQQFNKCGELCRSSGINFGYHNHNFEFKTMVEGIKLYDYILTHTDPSLVVHQLDIGNMFGAGGMALNYIKKYPGRFELMHVKDEVKVSSAGDLAEGYESCILGKGVLPLKEILKVARKTGSTSQFIVEQESYQGMNPFDCVKIDLQIMKHWGY